MLRDELSILIVPAGAERPGGGPLELVEQCRQLFPAAPVIVVLRGDQSDEVAGPGVTLVHAPAATMAGARPGGSPAASAAGLARVGTRYVMKLDADLRLGSDLGLHFYNYHLAYQPKGYSFRQPIAVASTSTGNWMKGRRRLLLSPGTSTMIGLAEDLRDLYAATPADPEAASPGQYLMVRHLVRKGLLHSEDLLAHKRGLLALNRRVFAEDFLVLDAPQLDCWPLDPEPPHSLRRQADQLRHAEWVAYCGVRHMPLYRAGRVQLFHAVVKARIAAMLGQAGATWGAER